MTHLSPIDALALPAELARQPRLDSNDWQLRAFLMTPGGPGAYLDPHLDATLVPWSERAIGQVSNLTGQCFLAGNHLWRITGSSLQFDAGGMATVEISCRSIWQQPSEQDSRKALPTPCLP